MDKSHNTQNKKYILSLHAIERYHERVGKGKTKADAIKWVTRAIRDGYVFEEYKDGRVAYKYRQYKIVVQNKLVITISYHKNEDFKDLKDDVTKTIRNKLKRELRPLLRNKKDTSIAIHEAHIRCINAKSPKVKKAIQETIQGLETDLKTIKGQINSVVQLGHKYNVQKDELINE